jgi:hypothetical protein
MGPSLFVYGGVQMIYPIEQIEGNLLSTEHQLLYKLYLEQRETNRLLSILTNEKEQTEEMSDSHIEAPHKRRGRPRTA